MLTVCQPAGSQVVELASAYVEAGRGILPSQGAVVEEFEGVPDYLCGQAMEKLFLFILGL